ncbi:XdhC family protein [Burkholderia perseverans]|uniref:XdhC family protein n=1 Tax=Burkholderia perseverans TaxID=2615214 RepID=UPI001FEE3590|nr:XdhC family protein [Burkholderia perseverans]
MDSVDLDVLRTSARWLAAGRRVLLATVVRTWGSSPRPVGALLALRDDGRAVGSVSGGCIEDDLIARVREAGITCDARPETIRYGISADEAHRFGLPCGGTLELVLEPLSAASGIAALCEAIDAGRLVARTLTLATGAATLDHAVTAADGVTFDGASLRTVHGPRYRMLVIGAGQLSRYLCRIATGLDYQVTVCDPREEQVEAWDVPGTRLVRTMPDDTVLEMRLDARSCVIALTHDPKLDDLALMEALKTPAFYVGALGSRRNNAARRERLAEFDLDAAQLARLHGPAGLHIGSRTPPEIALSILAEVTAVKNGIAIPHTMNIAVAKTGESG